MNETVNKQMLLGRLKILADRYHVTTVIREIFKRLYHFFFSFSQSEHDTTFGSHPSFFQSTDYFHATPVFCLYPYLPGKTLNSFNIMRHYFRGRIDDSLYVLLITFEIGDKCFK